MDGSQSVLIDAGHRQRMAQEQWEVSTNPLINHHDYRLVSTDEEPEELAS